MAKLKIRKIGNSLGTILPNEILQKLRVGEGDEIFAVADEDGIKLTPYDPDFEEAVEAFEEGRKRYRNALRKLSK